MNKFKKKALAFGEVHGISGLTKAKLDIITNWLLQDLIISICLERDSDQQAQIEDWIQSNKVSNEFKSRFLTSTTSQFLDDQYYFFQELSLIALNYPRKIKVFCVDISFNEPTDEASRLVLSARDEDHFDSLREKFIIERLREHQPCLDRSDKVLWIAGNMHASKTSNYFPLNGSASNHIPTAAMWLDETYGLESIYTLPFSGAYSYQQQGNLKINEFESTDWAGESFDGFRPAKAISKLSNDFKMSYDWVYGIKNAIAARSISEF